MTDILLNECGDIDYTTTPGKLTIVTGVDAIRQRWLIYIRTYLGEWFLDQSIGVPYFQQVLKKGVSRQVLKQVFTVASLQVPGVIQVVSVIVDSLDVATRFAEITVTCIVTGDEGPETGVFKFTGTIPPEGCDVAPPAPLQIDDQWYWFDPNDLDFVEGQSPYVPGSPIILVNKFETQIGSPLCDNTAAGAEPRIVAVINGRKALDARTADDIELVAGFGLGGAQVRALRTTMGQIEDGPFTVFGVYQPLNDPGASFDPLMGIRQVNDAGTVIRYINLEIGDDPGDPGLRFQVKHGQVSGSEDDDITDPAAGVSITDAWAFCLQQIDDENNIFALWVNGVLIDTVFTGSTESELSGDIIWNGSIDTSTGNVGATFNRTYVGDLIGYSRFLTDAEVGNVFAFLTNKWGI